MNNNKNFSNIELEEILYGYVEGFEEKMSGAYTVHVIHVNTQKGRIPFKFWDIDKKHPKEGDYIKIKIFDINNASNELQTYKSISMDSKKNKSCYCDYIPINEEDVPEEYKKIHIDRTEQIKKAEKYLLSFINNDSNWNNKYLSKFIKDAIEKYPKLLKIPAAVGHHHTYEGGLLVHSYEVNFLCNAIAEACEQLYPGIVDKDVINVSSWLHDIGKTEVYYLDESGNSKIYSDKEKKINHILRGHAIFEKLAEKHNLDSDFIDKVSHCILSHQDRIEWDTPVEPIDLEAVILARADKISSELSKNE
jgi:putative nucleotidyltransferase with HDIG domain